MALVRPRLILQGGGALSIPYMVSLDASSPYIWGEVDPPIREDPLIIGSLCDGVVSPAARFRVRLFSLLRFPGSAGGARPGQTPPLRLLIGQDQRSLSGIENSHGPCGFNTAVFCPQATCVVIGSRSADRCVQLSDPGADREGGSVGCGLFSGGLDLRDLRRPLIDGWCPMLSVGVRSLDSLPVWSGEDNQPRPAPLRSASASLRLSFLELRVACSRGLQSSTGGLPPNSAALRLRFATPSL